MLFFVYELMLFGVVLGMQRLVYARRETDAATAATVRKICGFVLLQYGGWAFADAVLLAGSPLGHLIRLVPNLLYYAAFLPFVFAVVEPEGSTEAPA